MNTELFMTAIMVLTTKGYVIEASEEHKTLRMVDPNGKIIVNIAREDFETILIAVKEIPGIGGFVSLLGSV